MKRFVVAAALASNLAAGAAFAGGQQQSFTPTSLRVPVRRVALEGDGAPADIYRCTPSATNDCTVDLAAAASLDALFAGVANVAPGHYDTLAVYACDWEGHYDVRVHGSVVIGRSTYYTAGDAVLTNSPAAADYTTVRQLGCTVGPKLPVSLDLTAGGDVALDAWFSLVDSAWVTAGRAAIGDGCVRTPTGTALSVCVAAPTLVPQAGSSGSATLERYLISDDVNDSDGHSAGGEVLLLVDAMNHVFGGFLRPLYSETSVPPRLDFDLPFTRFDAALGGSYLLQTPGDGDAPYRYQYPAFERQSHSGMSLQEGMSTPVPYRAVRQTQ